MTQQLECRPIFPNSPYGLWSTKYTDEQLQFLWDEIKLIQDSNYSREENPDFRYDLVGHIQHEFKLTDKTRHSLGDLLQPLLEVQIVQNKAYAYKFAVCDQDLPIVLEQSWINFQKKYEYNPVHRHTGLFSFVLWLKIPYTRKDEDGYYNTPDKDETMNGNFHTFFVDQYGGMTDYNIALSSEMENCCLMFPAEAHHCAYPFYTSDEYRISVSGTFVFKTK